MSALTGFLFSDVEASTERWEASPARMATAMRRHDAILDSIIARHGGVIQDRAGDGVFATFVEPSDPLSCALDIQRAISAEDWDDVCGLKVRLGIHARASTHGGVAQTAINRASRIAASAWGGQIVVSTEAANAYGAPEGAELCDLGVVYLKGIPEAMRLYGLTHPDLPIVQFPPLRSHFRGAGVLPLHADPIVGRERDLAALMELLGQTRFVSVIGPGGNGKTRLALELASNLQSDRPVIFLSAQNLSAGADLVGALGAALNLPYRHRVGHESQLIEYLRDKRMLVVFDNADAMANDAELLGRIVRDCANMGVVVTSRAPLCVTGETLYRLGGVETRSRSGNYADSAAFQLFVHAAQSRNPEFTVATSDFEVLEALGVLAGGSPLALRMMAQWTTYLSLAEIVEKCREGLDFLSDPTEADHRRTLRNVFEESWRQLDRAEQAGLARLSIFAGAFDWKLAEDAVCVPLTVFARLEQKGLLEPAAQRQFTIHPLLRGYAREKLSADAPLEEEVNERHATYFLELLRSRMADMVRRGQGVVLDELQQHIEEIKKAWRASLATPDLHVAQTAAEPLCYFLELRSLLRDGVGLFDASLVSGDAALRPQLEAIRANFLVQQGEAEAALRTARGVLETAAAPPLARAHAHMAIANVHHTRLEVDRAKENYERATEIRRSEGDKIGLAFVTISLASLHLMGGETETARTYIKEGFKISQQIGLTFGIVVTHLLASDVAAREGRSADAYANLMRGLELERSINNPQYRAQLLRRAGAVAHQLGKLNEAEAHNLEAVDLLRDLGDARGHAQALADLGAYHLSNGQTQLARTDFLTSVGLAEAFGSDSLAAIALLGLAQVERELGNVAFAREIMANIDPASVEDNCLYTDLFEELMEQAQGSGRSRDLKALLQAIAEDSEQSSLRL